MSAGDVMYEVSEQMIIIMMDLRCAQSSRLKTDRLTATTLFDKPGVKLATRSFAEENTVWWKYTPECVRVLPRGVYTALCVMGCEM